MNSELWTDRAESDARVGEVRAAWQTLEPFTDGFYVNAMTDDMSKGVRENYGPNYSRLQQLKKQYDPAAVPAQCDIAGVDDSTTSSAAAGRAR
jgi:hypothetical protein